jgi:hypothetical protein
LNTRHRQSCVPQEWLPAVSKARTGQRTRKTYQKRPNRLGRRIESHGPGSAAHLTPPGREKQNAAAPPGYS